VGDLSRGSLHPNLGTEVNGQLPGRLPRRRKIAHLEHPTNADVDGGEVLEVDQPAVEPLASAEGDESLAELPWVPRTPGGASLAAAVELLGFWGSA